jgi:hypothetical protein
MLSGEGRVLSQVGPLPEKGRSEGVAFTTRSTSAANRRLYDPVSRACQAYLQISNRTTTSGSGIGSEASMTFSRMVLVAASCRTRARE